MPPSKRKKEDKGLKESQKDTKKKRCRHKTKPEGEVEATRADAHEEQDKEKEGLKEGQIPTTPTLEAIPPESKEKDQEKVPSESGFSLTSTRLKIHQETQDAIKGLKEGHLSEEDFWKKINNSDRQPLWKKFENERNKNQHAKSEWAALQGQGVAAKKKQLLLHFLKTGKTSEGSLKESREVSDSKKEQEWYAWVPWKQILDWYGKEEAVARVEAGMVPVKKVGKKFYEFLLIKQQTKLTLDQRKQIAAETVQALKGPELLACKKALETPRTEEEWKDLWSGKGPDKTSQLKDAMSDTDSASSPSEAGTDQDEKNPAKNFLLRLKEGSQKSEGLPGKTLSKKEKQELEKQAKEQNREEQKKLKEAKAKEAEDKWHKKLEEATQVAENEKDSKVSKMLQMVSKTVADLKKACKKAPEVSWGQEELRNLEQLRSQLEDMQLDTDLQDVKNTLVDCAKWLKAAKALFQSN